MARALITLETDAFGWLSYVAAINGDDGPPPDASEEQIAERERKAREILLADMGRIASGHAKHRRKAEQAAQIDAEIDALMGSIMASTVVTVDIVE